MLTLGQRFCTQVFHFPRCVHVDFNSQACPDLLTGNQIYELVRNAYPKLKDYEVRIVDMKTMRRAPFSRWDKPSSPMSHGYLVPKNDDAIPFFIDADRFVITLDFHFPIDDETVLFPKQSIHPSVAANDNLERTPISLLRCLSSFTKKEIIVR